MVSTTRFRNGQDRSLQSLLQQVADICGASPTVGAHIVRLLRVPSHSAMRADDEQRPLQIACSVCGKQWVFSGRMWTFAPQHAPNGKEQQINNNSTTKHALCSAPEMTEMISETCEAHVFYFYPKTGKKCWQDAQAQYIKTNNPVQKQKHKLKF